MILDTLFALAKLGYLFAMWQVVSLSVECICKGHRALPVLALAIVMGLSRFSV